MTICLRPSFPTRHPNNNNFLHIQRSHGFSSLLLPLPTLAKSPKHAFIAASAMSELSSPTAQPNGPVREVASTARVRVFSAAEDPEGAKQCIVTIGQGFASEPNNDFYCADASLHGSRWQAIASNTLLRSPPHVRLLHSVAGGGPEGEHAAVAFAYSYPEDKAPEGDPDPPGTIDLSTSTRPESIPVRDEMLSYLSAKKAEFHETHGSFGYIAFLATRPEWRGRGLGSRLLRHLTDKADAAGRWCYLEATNEDNARLYQRHGFRTIETKVWTLECLPGRRVMLLPMSRPPSRSP
ncbi:hypothetical protein Agub_g13737 [Astrephomene gubernaculifera]|uniref:N-acetyltransferase domain-containing protein n=1 Tax=Astrephomene gubernaculifera TaxID=47775 RepID=A0AAD3E2J7_9CHLO|nr:hypothetical protein Agub_g13737 [Astrephomene gubernaculifera]